MKKQLGRDEAWALIPWLVNGTLDAEERQQVLAHAEQSAAFRREIAEQTRLREAVQAQEADDVVLERSLAAVSASLEVDKPRDRAPTSAPRLVDHRRRRQSQSRRLRSTWAIAAVGALAAVFVVMVFVAAPPQGGGFVTVTQSQDTPTILRLRAASNASDAALRRIFDAEGVVLEDGPNDANVYTLRAPSREAATRVGAMLELRDDVEMVLVGGSQ